LNNENCIKIGNGNLNQHLQWCSRLYSWW